MTSIQAGADESDEAFARRLQEQENGNPDQATPLMRPNGENPTVINARLNEMSNARGTVYIVCCINIPQILAAFIILAVDWDQHANDDGCPTVYKNQWNLWALFSALRMSVYTAIVVYMHVYKSYLNERPHRQARCSSFRNIVDASGLLWFVVGNIWVFGDDLTHCTHPAEHNVYNLCVAMLAINYIQICLPCFVALLLIPVFCFCMPCLIRILARWQTARAPVGATDETIRTLPLTIVTEEHILRLGDNSTCPICLSELCVGDEARLLQCRHIFHKQCVDEWLRVNASCPTCRLSILAGSEGQIRVERVASQHQPHASAQALQIMQAQNHHLLHHHHHHHHTGQQGQGQGQQGGAQMAIPIATSSPMRSPPQGRNNNNNGSSSSSSAQVAYAPLDSSL